MLSDHSDLGLREMKSDFLELKFLEHLSGKVK